MSGGHWAGAALSMFFFLFLSVWGRGCSEGWWWQRLETGGGGADESINNGTPLTLYIPGNNAVNIKFRSPVVAHFLVCSKSLKRTYKQPCTSQRFAVMSIKRAIAGQIYSDVIDDRIKEGEKGRDFRWCRICAIELCEDDTVKIWSCLHFFMVTDKISSYL